MQAAVAVYRETKRKIAQDKAVLPKFAVGGFAVYARVRRQGVTPKLMSTWTGPWRVVRADHSCSLLPNLDALTAPQSDEMV